MGGARLAGGSPRYQLYPTQGRQARLPARRWSRNSGSRSRRRSGLRRSSSTTAAIRRRPRRRSPRSSPAGPRRNGGRCSPPPIAASPSWRRCEEALRDPHFVERGLFAHQVAGPTGATMPALPVPIDPQFRGDAGTVKAVPKLSGIADDRHGSAGMVAGRSATWCANDPRSTKCGWWRVCGVRHDGDAAIGGGGGRTAAVPRGPAGDDSGDGRLGGIGIAAVIDEICDQSP